MGLQVCCGEDAITCHDEVISHRSKAKFHAYSCASRLGHAIIPDMLCFVGVKGQGHEISFFQVQQ
jgi:hypothetical protein